MSSGRNVDIPFRRTSVKVPRETEAIFPMVSVIGLWERFITRKRSFCRETGISYQGQRYAAICSPVLCNTTVTRSCRSIRVSERGHGVHLRGVPTGCRSSRRARGRAGPRRGTRRTWRSGCARWVPEEHETRFDWFCDGRAGRIGLGLTEVSWIPVWQIMAVPTRNCTTSRGLRMACNSFPDLGNKRGGFAVSLWTL